MMNQVFFYVDLDLFELKEELVQKTIQQTMHR